MASGIRELHKLLLERDRFRTALANGPKRIAATEASVAQQLAAIDVAKQLVIEHQKASDQKNLQFKMNQQKVIDQKSKLGMCKNNVEYEILNRQIDNELKQNDALETEYLVLLEQIDSGKHKLVELNRDLEARRSGLEKIKAEVASAEPGLKAEIKKYDGLCAVAAASAIPEPQMAYYKRLVDSKGADAIAVVAEGVCEGCDTELPPQHQIKVRMGEVLVCSQCSRFLTGTE